jgi:hypothetical protein
MRIYLYIPTVCVSVCVCVCVCVCECVCVCVCVSVSVERRLNPPLWGCILPIPEALPCYSAEERLYIAVRNSALSGLGIVRP